MGNELTTSRTREPLSELRQEVDRLFRDFFPSMGIDHEPSAAGWTPRADVAETDEKYIVNIDLPGLTKDDVTVEMENHELRISGQHGEEKEEKGTNYRHMERSRGRFYRAFSLPDADTDRNVKARLKDGVLHLEVAKSPEKKPRRIEIE